MKKLSLLTAIVLIVFVSCKKSSPAGGGTTGGGGTLDCGSVTRSWSTEVSAIISSSCATAGCHAAGSANGPGALTNYTAVYNSRSNIRSVVANGSMPKGGSLGASQKTALLCWIDQGAANN